MPDSNLKSTSAAPPPPCALSIGIDLGTSNCALAIVSAGPDGAALPPQIVPILQPEEGGATLAADLLPSFLYHPRPDERVSLGSASVPGYLARRAASRTPGRVTHAAKSWLGHRLVDRTRPILPWGSSEIPEAERLSPVGASALLLRQIWASVRPYLSAAVNPDAESAPPVILTVPASFAPDAQELTLAAAREAGLPANVRLLEEPQAVFYDWLSRHGGSAGLQSWLEQHLPIYDPGPSSAASRAFHLLVCDLGGGTSDFSLFTARRAVPSAVTELPLMERVAVGEHLLLGGDNMDAALAHHLETLLGGPQDARAWPGLVAAAREAKEALLARASDDNSPHTFAVTLPGGGLWGSTRSLTLEPALVRALVLDGFFPDCAADANPLRPASGLRELGLPYAPDTAITRHLAAFVRGHRVDAVLYNGGTLAPAFLRERLTGLLGAWQGRPVIELDNPRPDQAVALGAAWFGAQLRLGSPLIASHAAHAFWIETANPRVPRIESAAPGSERLANGSPAPAPCASLLCVLPHGTPLDHPVRVAPPGLLARVNQPISFRLYSSARPDAKLAGEVRPASSVHTALPELTAILQIPGGAPLPANGVLPVALEASLNAVGLLRVRCLPLNPIPGYPAAWDLRFPLRAQDKARRPANPALNAPASADSPGALPVASALSTALAAIEALFVAPAASAKFPAALASPVVTPPVAPRALLPELERLLGQPRADWLPATLRGLWPALAATLTRRQRSPDHEAVWLSLAGYCLRPGCGWPLDEARLNELWRVRELGLAFPRDLRVQTQEWILWRRVAGGLDTTRQWVLWRRWENQLRAAEVPAELIRAAATLERLPQATRLEFARRLMTRLPRLAATAPGQLEAWLWSLGRLCARRSLSGDPADVLPPAILGELLPALGRLKIGPHAPAACAALTQAVRCTGERALDAAPADQAVALALLTRWGATAAQLDCVRAVVAGDETAELQALAGDRLPAGLLFARHRG